MQNTNGSYRTADGKAQIDWELKQEAKGPVFTARGNYDRGSGQCIDSIAQAYPADEMVQRIAKVWRDWHLNDMNAGTPAQKALGWGRGRNVALDESTMTPAQKEYLTKRNEAKQAKARSAWAAEETQDVIRDARTRVRVLRLLKQPIADYYSELLQGVAAGRKYFGSYGGEYSQMLTAWKRYLESEQVKRFPAEPVTSEVFEDSLGAPCPETGLPYGGEWYYRAIPADVLAEIESWPRGKLESFYDFTAEGFLARNGIKLRAVRADGKAPAWSKPGEEHGQHYNVTLSRDGGGHSSGLDGARASRLTFDFYGSINDRKANKDPSAYDVLARIPSDAHCPDTFADFCAEYGYEEDSREAGKTFMRCHLFSLKLKGFFTTEELAQLSEIQ